MLLPLDGRSIAYDLTGPETGPVVCMTHSLASDSGMWAEQMVPLLQAGFRVLRLDMRGHGGSTPGAPGEYTLSGLAGDVAAVLDALGIAKVHFVGLSIGAMLGQAFALEHGNRLHSALFSDTLPASPAGSADVWQQRIRTVTEAGSVEPLADPTIERWFTEAFKSVNPLRHKQIRNTILGTSPNGYIGSSAALRNFDFVSKLPSLRLPVLVVCGDSDPGTPPAANQKIASLVPGALYEEVKDARHFPNVERPDAFNSLLLGWLWKQRAAN